MELARLGTNPYFGEIRAHPRILMTRLLPFFLLLSGVSSQVSAQSSSQDDRGNAIRQFGFGPALYFIKYNDEIVDDSRQVNVRSDSTIDFPGSQWAAPIGLEVHYAISLRRPRRFRTPGESLWASSRGFVLSPSLGVYDIDNGIDGLSAGVIFGFWRGNGNFEPESHLNFGAGLTVHRNQAVLANGIEEGMILPEGLQDTDLTTLRDVWGYYVLVSATVGF